MLPVVAVHEVVAVAVVPVPAGVAGAQLVDVVDVVLVLLEDVDVVMVLGGVVVVPLVEAVLTVGPVVVTVADWLEATVDPVSSETNSAPPRPDGPEGERGVVRLAGDARVRSSNSASVSGGDTMRSDIEACICAGGWW